MHWQTRGVRVRLLGGFAVEGVSERDLGSRKARTLLKLLSVRRGAPVSVDVVADVLWGDAQPAKPGEQVGVLVSRLRAAIGSERIVRSDAGYEVRPDWVDVDEVDALATAAAAALAEGRTAAARAAAAAALDLARGPLLGDEDGTWLTAARAEADAILTRARRVAIAVAEAAGDLDAVVTTAERVLAADPYDEDVLRSLMRAHLAARRPASALGVYARQRARIADDLGVPPTAETEALYITALSAADGDTVEAHPRATTARESSPPLAGREYQLRALDGALAAAAEGPAALVVVDGEAGMGKTALVDAWLDSIDTDALVVLRGRCDELGRDLPLQPIADALAGHLRQIGPEAATAAVGTEATVLAPLLGPLAGAGGVDGAGDGAGTTTFADPEQGRVRMFAALLAAVTRCAGGRIAVIVVDDLHRAASGTVAWLSFAHRRATKTLLLTTTRPPAPTGLTAAPATTIEVGALTPEEVAEVVGTDAAGDAYERTGGHPLLLAAITDGPAAVPDDVPATLRAAVSTQLAAIDTEAAATVRVAAVVGLDCDPDLVAIVRGISTVEAVMHLEAAMTTGLIVERAAGFSFRHELLREAIRGLSSAAHLAALHRDTASAIARRPAADPLAVAIHAREGGALDVAAAAFIDAAEQAAARFDLDTAEAHLAEAIDAAPERPHAYVVRARVRMSRAAFADAEDDAATAIAKGGGAPAFEVAGWVAYYRRDYERAVAFADEALAGASDDPLRVSAAALAGRVRHGAGDLRGALAHLTTPGDAPLAVRGVADVWLAQARLHQGRPEEALAALSRPMVAPDSLAHPWAPLHLRFNRAMALGQLGRAADVVRAADELLSVAGREGAVGGRFVAPANNVASWALRWSGMVAEAAERNHVALDATGGDAGPSAEGFAEGHYVALLDLAEGHLLSGDVDAAAALAAGRLAAVDGWNGTMAWHQRHRLGLLRSRLALLDGDRDGAAAHANAVAADASTRGAARYELLALATAGLADPTVPEARLDPVVDGLGRCAMLDGWVLVARLAAARRVDRWRAEAERRVAVVVAASVDEQVTRRFADRHLTG